MRRSRSALATVLAVAFVSPVASQDKDKKDEKAPEAKPEPAKKADEKAEEKPKTRNGLPAPPDELAKVLEQFEKDDEPARELKRCYASSLHYLLERDLERFVACFHKDFALHDGSGQVSPLPLADLRKRLREVWEKTPRAGLKLTELVDLAKAKVYSRAQAKAAGHDGWRKEPGLIAAVMEDGDWLVIAPTKKAALGEKASAFDAEVFYIFRRQDGWFRIVLGE